MAAMGSLGMGGIGLPQGYTPPVSAADTLALAATEKARALYPPASSPLFSHLESASKLAENSIRAATGAGELPPSVASAAAASSIFPYGSPFAGLPPPPPTGHAASLASQYLPFCYPPGYLSAPPPPPLSAGGHHHSSTPHSTPSSNGSPTSSSPQDIHRPVAYVLVKPEDHYRSRIPPSLQGTV